MHRRTSMTGLGMIALAVFCTSLALADESGTVKVGGGWMAFGVGANWGDGVLTFEGYEYPFSIRGLSVGDFGAAGFTGSGTAHNLRCAADFNGTYSYAAAGPRAVGDGAVVTMRNEHGVRIDLAIATPGFKVSLAGGGIAMQIPPSSFAAVRSVDATENGDCR